MSRKQLDISSKFLLIVAFVEGGAVMCVELLSAKMTAPFFGTSLYVWSAVLGITLFALTSGYYLGGIISERYPARKSLFLILLASTLFIGIMPYTGDAVMQVALNLSLKIGSIISLLVFLFPPLCLLGMTSPLIIRLLSKQIKTVGKITGSVYGTSTFGGILSTFLVGFYLIPWQGLKMTGFGTALLLGVISVGYYFLSKTREHKNR